ncbi:DUF2092 domain-containing protein [bacterium]|nr:DUF2092 domain-containing protein [bacterium]MCI0615350.1 DUF2092 domain-containing protein [bacterium]
MKSFEVKFVPGTLIVAMIFCAPLALIAQQSPAVPQTAETTVNPIEPIALETLQRMSDLLKKATKITFTANTTREQPATTGQLLEFFYTSHVSMVRPNLFRIDVEGDIWTASIWYDGKKITLMDPRTTFYAQADAPATIDDTVMFLVEKFQAPLPLAVLLISDISKKAVEGLKTGFEAGVVMVNGIKCRQLAFTEDEADWQLWIEDGPNPLPRRFSVTYKKMQGSPRVSISFSDWNLDAVIPANTFVFHMPEGATKVDVKRVP